MHAWHSGAHQLGRAAGVAGGALDAVELEDESSGGGDGVATALPGRRHSALSESSGSGCVKNLAIVVGRLVICITVVVFNKRKERTNTVGQDP